MSRLLFLLLALPALALAQSQLAIVGVTVIDATGAPPQPGMTVLVAGDRIAEIGKDLAVPADARRINAAGKFLIPGLWDMHVHAVDTGVLPLFTANGVTGIRIMWGARFHLAWRGGIAAGAPGPRLHIASAIVDGPIPIWRNSVAVGAAADARRFVEQARGAGFDFVKVYSFLTRESYFAIAEESKKLGMPFAGHVPVPVSAGEASDAGQRSIEHLSGILLAVSSREAELREKFMQALAGANPYPAVQATARASFAVQLESYSEEKAQALFATFRRNGTWQVPTLTVLRGGAYMDEAAFTNDPRLKYVSPAVRQSWDPKRDFRYRTRTAEDFAAAKRSFRRSLEIVGAMHRAGVPILAGTDVANPYCFPGFSLHDELELLVQAGLDPLAALQAATRDAAAFAGLRDAGTIERGKLADLVLLDADPLADIRNTTGIRAVMANGRLYDRKALDAMLAEAEAAAK